MRMGVCKRAQKHAPAVVLRPASATTNGEGVIAQQPRHGRGRQGQPAQPCIYIRVCKRVRVVIQFYGSFVAGPLLGFGAALIAAQYDSA